MSCAGSILQYCSVLPSRIALSNSTSHSQSLEHDLPSFLNLCAGTVPDATLGDSVSKCVLVGWGQGEGVAGFG